MTRQAMKIKYTIAKIYSPSIVMKLTQMKLDGTIEDFSHRKGMFMVSFVVKASSDGHKQFNNWLKKNKMMK